MLESRKINAETHLLSLKELPRANASLKLHLGLIKQTILNLLDQLDGLNGADTPGPSSEKLDLYHEVRNLEVQLISDALQQTYGNQKRAARLLGLKPTTLNAKIKKYNIPCWRNEPHTVKGSRA